MPCSAPPSIWLRMPSGFEIGPQSLAMTSRLTLIGAGVLVDVDVGDHRAVAVVALVQHAGECRALRVTSAAGEARRGDGRGCPVRGFAAAALTTSFRRGSLQVAQPVLDRIGLHVRGDFVHEALVRERVLQPLRRRAAGR